jgi:hypothetical protein
MVSIEPTGLPPMSMRGRSVEDVRRCNKGIRTSESSDDTWNDEHAVKSKSGKQLTALINLYHHRRRPQVQI